jgi:hypothetical protein
MPVCGAIAAYLEGLYIGGIEDPQSREAVVVDLLRVARSPRRRDDTRKRVSRKAVASWLALVFSCYLGDREYCDWLIDWVSRIDISVGLDLHALRTTEPSGRTLPERLLACLDARRRTLHGLFNYGFDRPRVDAAAATRRLQEDQTEVREILRELLDPDVLAALVVAATPRDEQVVCPRVWHSMVPDTVLADLQQLSSRLRDDAVTLDNGQSVTRRVLLVDDFALALPGIARTHDSPHGAAYTRWLTAHVLAFACGGRLPHWAELAALYRKPEIVRIAFDAKEEPERHALRGRFEWLMAPDPEQLCGDAFGDRGARHSLRPAARVCVARTKAAGDPDGVWLDGVQGTTDAVLLRPPTEVVPHPGQFGAFHVVFPRTDADGGRLF